MASWHRGAAAASGPACGEGYGSSAASADAAQQAAHRPRRQGRRAGERAERGVLALCLAVEVVGSVAGQMEQIYNGGTAKWYDSFNSRLDAGFLGDTYCKGNKLKGFGRDRCEANHGCCWVPPVSLMFPETEDCRACQEIRGTWQGVLGTCVFKDIPTVVSFDRTTNLESKPVTTSRCIPTEVDPSMLIFKESDGKMATGVSPSSAANNGGRFAFDFQYSRNVTSGEIDVLVATFLGNRLLFGKYQVEESELGSTLFLALGVTRSKTAKPQRTSAKLPDELIYVFFEGFRIDEFTPAVDAYAAKRLPAGSCKHVVSPGEDMDSISRRDLLTWQEIYAFNSHVYEPEDLRPGEILSVGRHHEVKGPCINHQLRQNGPDDSRDLVVDYTCTCTSRMACRSAVGLMKGETLFGIATRYGTSWQRIVDMNPKLFEGCTTNLCVITPGDHLCIVCSHPGFVHRCTRVCSACLLFGLTLPVLLVGPHPGLSCLQVPYLRNVMCGTEYRRYPVVDNHGRSPGYLQTFFTCDPKWRSKFTVEKCCQVPRCKCCTKDGYAGIRKDYDSWNSAPTANRCDVTAKPHAKCLQDPLIPATTALNSPLMYTLLCDDDCQLRCDSEDPTVLDPKCPLQVGLTMYTGMCQEKRMLNGNVAKVCT